MRRTEKTPSRAFAYLRVSTSQQAESGLGLDAQRASIEGCAGRLGLVLVSTFVDGGSSGSLAIEDRPVLMEAVGTLRRGDVLIVAKRDRIARDVILSAVIERLVRKRGGRIVSAAGEGTDSDDPTGVLMRRIVDSFAEHERLIIGCRTAAALRAKRQRGERVSRFAPFGFRFSDDGRTVEAVPTEQRILTRIRDARLAGLSLSRIARELNQDGLYTRSGAPWRFEYVRSLLRVRA